MENVCHRDIAVEIGVIGFFWAESDMTLTSRMFLLKLTNDIINHNHVVFDAKSLTRF